MRHIIVLVSSIFIIYLMVYTYNIGGAYHGGHAGDIIKNLSPKEKELSDKKEDENITSQLKILQDKTNNTAKFKVSTLYIQKCASCHGINGHGIIGRKLFGQSQKEIYIKMQEYKTGKIKNVVMQQILENITDEQVQELSNEIGNFINLNKKDI